MTKTNPRVQSLIDAVLKASTKKSSFTPSQQKTIQRVKTQNIAKGIICPNCNTQIA